MADELMKEEKARVIKLGEKEYQLSPLNVNVLAGIEEEFGGGLDKIGESFEKKPATSLRALLYILLRDNYREITKTEAGKLITLKNYKEVDDIIAQALYEQK